MFTYMKVKGQVQNSCRDLGLQNFFIYQPGLILNRVHDDRMGEKIFAKMPFISKIEVAVLGNGILQHALKNQLPYQGAQKPNEIVTHNDL